MKNFLINKFPGTLAAALIGFACYEAGGMNTKKQLLHKVELCVDRQTIKNSDELFKHFGHTEKNTIGSYFVHAEAFTERNWAKCFRGELYK